MSDDEVARRVAEVRATITRACDRAGRDPSGITIVAAAKTVHPDRVRSAIAAGITAVGHNYVQELRRARDEIADPVEWHYIGALRTGTAHQVADAADVVETVAGERAARRLAGRATRAGRRLRVLIEVDFTGERPGVAPDGLDGLADIVAGLEGLSLTGLMTIAPLGGDPEAARPWFARLRALRDTLGERQPDLRELSMGMSSDLAIAVEEGATMVRVGTGLFGPRAP